MRSLSPQVAFPLLLLITALAVGWPLVLAIPYGGHDTLIHLWRSAQFYVALGDGHFPVRWLPDLVGGYGLPVFVFIPPLAYFFTALFQSLGLGVFASYKLVMLAAWFLSGVAMYSLARQWWPPAAALLAASAYMIAPYRLVDVYVRGALPESLSLVFIPLVFLGIKRCWDAPSWRMMLGLALALAGLMLSHNILAVMGYAWAGLGCAYFFWQRRDPKALALVLLGFLFALGLSAFYWFPALAEKHLVMMDTAQGALRSAWQDHFVGWWQLLSTYWNFGISRPGPKDFMAFQVGTFALYGVGLAWFALPTLSNSKERSWLWALQIGFWVSLWLVTPWSAWLWKSLAWMRFFQFPWRGLAFTIFFSAWLMGFWHTLAMNRPQRIRVLVIAACWWPVIQQSISWLGESRYPNLIMFQWITAVVAAMLGMLVLETQEQRWLAAKPWTPAPAALLVWGVMVVNVLPLSALPLQQLIMPELVVYRSMTPDRFERNYLRQQINTAEHSMAMIPKTAAKLPQEVPLQAVEVVKGEATVNLVQQRTHRWTFRTRSNAEHSVRVNLFYYPGWVVFADHRPLSLRWDEFGRIVVDLAAGEHEVAVLFQATPKRRRAEIISGASWLVMLGMLAAAGITAWRHGPIPT